MAATHDLEADVLELQRSVGNRAVGDLLTRGRQQARAGGQPLDAQTRQEMEQSFGQDFGGVRLHTDTDAASVASLIGAKAFTYGEDIWIGPEGSPGDRSLLAHELAHVVQQSGVAPSSSTTISPAHAGSTLENEAALAQQSIAEGEAAPSLSAASAPSVQCATGTRTPPPPIVQRVLNDPDANRRLQEKATSGLDVGGQLVEEVLYEVVRQTLSTEEGRRSFGIESRAGAGGSPNVEYVEGYRIRDANNQAITDGMILEGTGDTRNARVVFEAKRGAASAKELHRTHEREKHLTATQKEEIASYRRDVVSMRAAGEAVSDRIIIGEEGGQIRLTNERLRESPRVRIYDRDMRTFTEVEVRVSNATRWVVSAPREVSLNAQVTALRSLGFNIHALNLNDLTKENINETEATIKAAAGVSTPATPRTAAASTRTAAASPSASTTPATTARATTATAAATSATPEPAATPARVPASTTTATPSAPATASTGTESRAAWTTPAPVATPPAAATPPPASGTAPGTRRVAATPAGTPPATTATRPATTATRPVISAPPTAPTVPVATESKPGGLVMEPIGTIGDAPTPETISAVEWYEPRTTASGPVKKPLGKSPRPASASSAAPVEGLAEPRVPPGRTVVKKPLGKTGARPASAPTPTATGTTPSELFSPISEIESGGGSRSGIRHRVGGRPVPVNTIEHPGAPAASPGTAAPAAAPEPVRPAPPATVKPATRGAGVSETGGTTAAPKPGRLTTAATPARSQPKPGVRMPGSAALERSGARGVGVGGAAMILQSAGMGMAQQREWDMATAEYERLRPEIERLNRQGEWVVVYAMMDELRYPDILAEITHYQEPRNIKRFALLYIQHGRTQEEALNPPSRGASINAVAPGDASFYRSKPLPKMPEEGRTWRSYQLNILPPTANNPELDRLNNMMPRLRLARPREEVAGTYSAEGSGRKLQISFTGADVRVEAWDTADGGRYRVGDVKWDETTNLLTCTLTKPGTGEASESSFFVGSGGLIEWSRPVGASVVAAPKPVGWRKAR